MNEKMYKDVSGVAIGNLVLGILTLVMGLAGGVLLLVSAAKLLKTRNGMVI